MTDEEYREMLEETLRVSKDNQERYSKVLDTMEEVSPRLVKMIEWAEKEMKKEELSKPQKTKQTIWVNVYKTRHLTNNLPFSIGGIYAIKAQAMASASPSKDYLGSFPVEVVYEEEV